MKFFNKDRIVSEEIKPSKEEEKSYDEMSTPELIKIARDDNLPFDKRLNAFMKTRRNSTIDSLSGYYGSRYFPSYLSFNIICIDGKVKLVYADDKFKEELLEVANMLYDAQEFVWIDGYKRVNLDMTTKHGDFKYEIGKEYTQEKVPCLCSSGFHFCYNAEDTENHYLPSESRLLKIRAYVPISEKEHSFDMHGNEEYKCTCKRIKIVAEVDIEEEFPDEWMDKLYDDISSYHSFMEDLESNLESRRKLKERFKNNPLETVMDYTKNTFKYYYGESLTELILTILDENVPQEKKHTIFDSMIRYAMALTETRTRLNAAEVISTLKVMIDLLV